MKTNTIEIIGKINIRKCKKKLGTGKWFPTLFRVTIFDYAYLHPYRDH